MNMFALADDELRFDLAASAYVRIIPAHCAHRLGESDARANVYYAFLIQFCSLALMFIRHQ